MAVLGGCAYISEKQGEWIFQPTKQEWRWGGSSRYPVQEQWIPVGEGQKLHAWFLPGPRADSPALLYLHGARWNLNASVTRIDRWRELGFAVLAVDYRGFGKSSELAPSETSASEDAEAAWKALGALVPGRPRYIVGHSLGGAIAADLARREPQAAGLVLEATFTSVQDMVDQSPWGFLPVGLLLTQRFDTLSKVRDLHMPVLVAHGTRDTVVPFHMGERLFQAVHAPKRFIRVEGAGHHNLSGAGFSDYRKAVKELFGVG